MPSTSTANGRSTSTHPVRLRPQAWAVGSTPSATVPASNPKRDMSRYSPASRPMQASAGATSVCQIRRSSPVRRKNAMTAMQTSASTTTIATTASPLNQ